MFRKLLMTTVSLLLLGLNVNAEATTLTFDFTGDCDDCAFAGNPLDQNFNPFDDGLTQSVTGSLRLEGVSFVNGVIDNVQNLVFEYNGSNLINPFALDDPFLRTLQNLDPTTGMVLPGLELTISSSSNVNNPFNVFPDPAFPNFCTSLGLDVLGLSACEGVEMVTFALDSEGNFSISGTPGFDIGTGGTLTPVSPVPLPAAFWFFGTALIGLFGVTRKRAGAMTG